MNKSLLTVALLLFIFNISSAQIVRNIYHISDIGGLNEVKFDFPTAYKLVAHASTNVLIHTKVSISNCNENIVTTYADSLKRYDVIEEFSKTDLRLVAADKVRKRFSTSRLSCYEDVSMTIYIPDSFNIVDQTFIRKSADAVELTKINSLREN